MSNAIDAFLHERIGRTLLFHIGIPLCCQRRSIQIGHYSLYKRVPDQRVFHLCIEHSCQRKCIYIHLRLPQQVVHFANKLLFLSCNFIEHEIGIDLRFAPHLHIISILLLISISHFGSRFNVFIFRIKAFELAIFLSSRTRHIKFTIFCAKKVPTMHVIYISVMVIITTIKLLFWVCPKHWSQRNTSGVCP